jgi:hypothetical protein
MQICCEVVEEVAVKTPLAPDSEDGDGSGSGDENT